MRAVTVVGGGFSGLATAYYLSSAGVPVQIVEKAERVGGLIATLLTPHGAVETAAIAMRNSPRVDALCRDLGLRMIASRSSGRSRYIYRQRPTRWPLTPGESLALLARLASATARGARRHRPHETVEQWGARVLGRRATRWLVGPALQSVYAGDPSRLSASLVFGAPERPAGPGRGAVAPACGMQQLIDALASRLRAREVDIRLNARARLDGSAPTVICTAACDAAEILRDVAPAASQALSTIDMLPLVRITAFYPDEETPRGRGRGILFPSGGDIRALGVLFNTNVFPDRDAQYSETWIYGGAADRNVVDLSEDDLGTVMDRDRQVLCGRCVPPAARLVHRWRAALPHYDLQLESVRARGFDLPAGVFLVGNYVGGIGLSMLLEQAAAVATRVREMT